MDIFEFAKKMELDGKNRYQEQYDKETNQGIKSILIVLINQEQHHYDALNSLEHAGKYVEYKEASFRGVKNLFEEMKDELDRVSKDHIQFYQMVLEIEKKTEAFYLSHAKEYEGDTKKILLSLAKEEHNHVIIIQNIIDFISKPNTWIEDAEFNHMIDY
ncbi:MAG: ferritin family protein [Candidatus Woesearchaeota archaeon]|jgi:rubrerythrin